MSSNNITNDELYIVQKHYSMQSECNSIRVTEYNHLEAKVY